MPRQVGLLPFLQATQALRVSRGTALIFSRIFGIRWGGVVSPTPRPPLPPGKTRYPLCRRLVGPRAGLDGRKMSPPGFFLNIYCTFNHIDRNFTSASCFGNAFPIPCHLALTLHSLTPIESVQSINGQFPTCCIRLAARYDFHLARRKKSIQSSSDRCLCCCIRYITRCASNHSIALCRCGGQNWKWGRRHQSARTRRGS